MRSDVDVYDHLLRFQAEASFGLERRLFEFAGFREAQTIVDVGCGNAYFAALLATSFPEKKIIGVEPDESLIGRARARAMPNNLDLFLGRARDLPPDFAADVLIARLMMMYVRDPEAIAAWASTRIPHIIIVDAADDLFRVDPPVPLFSETLKANEDRIRKLGGQRDIQTRTVALWEAAGYDLDDECEIAVQSSLPSMKPLMHLLMLLNAELVVGTPLKPDLIEELHGWVFDDSSYLQYGLRARRFLRRGERPS